MTAGQKADRCRRICEATRLLAWFAAVLLAVGLFARMFGEQSVGVLAPLGLLVGLPAGIVSAAAWQLAGRYAEVAE